MYVSPAIYTAKLAGVHEPTILPRVFTVFLKVTAATASNQFA